MNLADLLSAMPVTAARPWPRHQADAEAWRAVARGLADGHWRLLSLWACRDEAHLAVAEPDGAPVLVSLACPDGRFPSIGAAHPAAIRLERAAADLFGLVPEGAQDRRPWLDHGRWRLTHPRGDAGPPHEPTPYPFLPVDGEGLHQIAVGPVHAGVIEPGHFRFTANGETVARLEARLGYVHRGLEAALEGAPLDRAAALASRASGDSTVAYAFAFARAVEAALGVEAPSRAQALRGLMAELERIANHLGDIGAICNDAAFALMHAHTGVLREAVLRASHVAFGHRLMMDVVSPGGVTKDLAPEGRSAIEAAVAAIRARLPLLADLYDDTASLQDRTVSTGVVQPDLARRFAAGGFVGRASGRRFDARQAWPYAPYERLAFEVPVREDGDVNARVWIRFDELGQSLSLIDQILAVLPDGPTHLPPPAGSGEGAAMVESFRGDLFAWVRVAEGRVEAAHLRDPSWFQWPLLEAAIEGNIVADFPLCNKSFNCSYAGVDL